MQAVDVLDDYPYVGRLVPEFDEGIFRELIFQDYRIIYRMVDERPWILTVVHGSVDLRAELRRRGISPTLSP